MKATTSPRLNKMNNNLAEYADRLKDNATKPELAFKTYLEKTHPKLTFEFQFPISPYIVDFYFPALNLIVELDGTSHEGKEDYDHKRNETLEENGFNIIHVKNHVAEDHPEQIIDTMRYAAKQILTERYRARSSYFVDIEKYTEKLSSAQHGLETCQQTIDVVEDLMEATQ